MDLDKIWLIKINNENRQKINDEIKIDYELRLKTVDENQLGENHPPLDNHANKLYSSYQFLLTR